MMGVVPLCLWGKGGEGEREGERESRYWEDDKRRK